ncbi:MAG: SRPBCC family protein [Propionibacteriales bacterium]|nr:SRPBCC family protein [Propionibacteriales bacterium]
MTLQRHVEANARVDIGAQPGDVYLWVTDPGRVPLWVKDLVESRPAPGNGAFQVGARSIEVIQVGRSRLEVPAEVTALDPDRLVENRMDMPEGTCLSRVGIEETPDGCTVTQTMEAVFPGMRWLPSSALKRMLSRRLRADLLRLKTLVENG